jgi:23S rRNA (uracil1939-C5)-methyltransferase
LKVTRGQRLNVHVDRLSVGGRGVARHDKLVVFIPDAAPGDDLEIELTLVKSNYSEARILNILKRGPSRVQPPCPVADRCGGCNWQHVSYASQLIEKRGLVRESIRRFSGYDVSMESTVGEVVASPTEWRYRNRIQLHHRSGELGFFKRSSHEIVNIDDCLITETAITDRFSDLKRQFSSEAPGRFEVFITTGQEVKTRGVANREAEGGDGDEFDGNAFSQVNTRQNENLISAVLDAATRAVDRNSAKPIFDFYSGNGNFTFPLAKTFVASPITAVELNRESCKFALEKASSEFPGRGVKIVESGVEGFLRTEPSLKNSLVLLDPPRTGCSTEVSQFVSQARPHTLIYVSCNPVTLGRDLKIYREAGFKLVSVQPFDMFPQTDHVETLAVLQS